MPPISERIERLQKILSLTQREIEYLVNNGVFSARWQNLLWELLDREDLILRTLRVYQKGGES